MKITSLDIPDVLVIEPKLIKDERGFFFESFNLNEFRNATSSEISFVQVNHSSSTRGVLRGLHYQIPPYAQGKLVKVIQGEVFDVAVDIRKSSPTFGKFVSLILSATNKKQLWIPEGFAHGFLALSKNAEILYQTNQYYQPKNERCIIWNDARININWPKLDTLNISSKDLKGESLDVVNFFS